MIGPTSETARSMMASLNGAMQQGMPPDQAIAYVKSQAMSGVAPLVDLYALLKQFERMKQPKQEMPPGGSVREQLNSLEQQMGQGLGGLNAGRMETPQFVGGGIVAFQQGGGMPPPNDPTSGLPFLTGQYQQAQEQYNDPDFMKKDIERRRQLRSEYDIGEGGEYQREQQAEIDRMKAEMPGREREANKMDMAEFFFNIAAEASKPGATVLSSIAGAGPGYVRQSRATKKELDALQNEARRARLDLLKANELERTGDINAADALRTQGLASMTQTGQEIAKIVERQQEQKEEREFRTKERREKQAFETREREAQEEAREKIEAKRGELEMARIQGNMKPKDVAAQAYLDAADEFGDNSEQAQAALQRYINLEQAGQPTYGVGGGGGSSSQGRANSFAGFSATPLPQ
jgi:hypothetical protein